MSASRARYPDLEGTTVFVSGGASGIGAAIVRAFAEQRARVAFIDIDDAGRRTPCAGEYSDDVRYWHCDVRDVGALQATIADAGRALGPVRVLVNNAARDDRHAFDEVTPGVLGRARWR